MLSQCLTLIKRQTHIFQVLLLTDTTADHERTFYDDDPQKPVFPVLLRSASTDLTFPGKVKLYMNRNVDIFTN